MASSLPFTQFVSHYLSFLEHFYGHRFGGLLLRFFHRRPPQKIFSREIFSREASAFLATVLNGFWGHVFLGGHGFKWFMSVGTFLGPPPPLSPPLQGEGLGVGSVNKTLAANIILTINTEVQRHREFKW